MPLIWSALVYTQKNSPFHTFTLLPSRNCCAVCLIHAVPWSVIVSSCGSKTNLFPFPKVLHFLPFFFIPPTRKGYCEICTYEMRINIMVMKWKEGKPICYDHTPIFSSTRDFTLLVGFGLEYHVKSNESSGYYALWALNMHNIVRFIFVEENKA